MSGIEQQKNINFGAKLTGKIMGGIYFNGNDAETILPGNTWVRIGNGTADHTLFQLMPIQPVSAPVSSGVTAINDYFELSDAEGPTSSQALWYRYGKRGVHYCSYTFSVLNAAATPTLQSRVSSVNPVTASVTLYPQSVRTIEVASDLKNVQITFPLVAPTGDEFYIELNAGAEDDPVIIQEAFLSIGE